MGRRLTALVRAGALVCAYRYPNVARCARASAERKVQTNLPQNLATLHEVSSVSCAHLHEHAVAWEAGARNAAYML